MDHDQTIAKLAQARALLHEVGVDSDNPIISRCTWLADQNLHWALWQLGAVDSLAPELEGE